MDNIVYSGAKKLRARDRALADSLRKKLEEYKRTSTMPSAKAGKELLIELCNHILKDEIAESTYREKKNPFSCPSHEEFVSIQYFIKKCNHLISDHYVNKRLKYDPKFFAFCGKRKGCRNFIQPQRAIHYLWNDCSLIIKQKLTEYLFIICNGVGFILQKLLSISAIIIFNYH